MNEKEECNKFNSLKMVIRVKLNCNSVDSNTETNKNDKKKKKKMPQIYETKCPNLVNFHTICGGQLATPAAFSGK